MRHLPCRCFALALGLAVSGLACAMSLPPMGGEKEKGSLRSLYGKALEELPKQRGRAASHGNVDAARAAAASLDDHEIFKAIADGNLKAAEAAIQERIGNIGDEPEQQRVRALLQDMLGIIKQRQGDMAYALVFHGQALDTLKSAGQGGRPEAVAVRNNMAVALYFSGEFEKAEQELARIIEKAGVSPRERARALNNRGLIYADTGRQDMALVDFLNAETDARNVGNKALLAELLNNQGRLFAEKKNFHRANQAMAESHALVAPGDDIALLANVLDSWGEILVAQGNFQEARKKLLLAQEVENKANAPLVKITILMNLGKAALGLGQVPEARARFDDALQLADKIQVSVLQREVLTERGRLKAGQKEYDAAIEDYRRAIELAEKARDHLKGEGERGFIRAMAQLYRDMVGVLMKRNGKGDAEEAFSFLDRSRNAGLQEQMAGELPEIRDQQARKDILGARGILRQEAALAQQLQAVLAGGGVNPEAVRGIQAKLDAVRTQATKALSELEAKYKGQYAHFVPAALSPKYLKDIQGMLPERTVLLSYAYGDDGLFIFAITRNGPLHFRQNPALRREDLEQKIAEFRDVFKNTPPSREELRIESWDQENWRPLRDASAWLYQQLLAPIADDLKAADRVIIAPTGQLYYVPFHALGTVTPAGELDFLGLSKLVSYVAPGSMMKAFKLTGEAAAKTGKVRILALGDIQFEEPGLKQLANSRSELESVEKIFGRDASKLLLGANATKQGLITTLAQSGKPGYQFLLLSTHGILDSRHPQQSYLAMEHGKRLVATEIASLDLRGLRLVSLSACETGMADDNPGADLMSLGEYVSLSGAEAVVATLWQVDDLETARLMGRMYQDLRKNASDRAGALQRAQRELASKPESRHPFFWAPFVLYGRGW